MIIVCVMTAGLVWASFIRAAAWFGLVVGKGIHGMGAIINRSEVFLAGVKV